MKKYLYHLELSVKNFDLLGNPEPDDINDGWMHLFGDFPSAAKFVFDIVHGYTGESIQSEIVKLVLTRYTEGGHNPRFKYSKGYHQYNLAIKFEGIQLKDLNMYKINEKTHKKFIKDLSIFWKNTFKNIDNKVKNTTIFHSESKT